MIPQKKPRGKALTFEQKQENKVISGIRIVVEHDINGVKRFGAMSNIYRNRRGTRRFDDSFMCKPMELPPTILRLLNFNR